MNIIVFTIVPFKKPLTYIGFDWFSFDGGRNSFCFNIGTFDRPSAYSMEGFENSGSDFMPQYKPYFFDGKAIITSPHKIYGPEQNDLALQLRKQGVDQVIELGEFDK